MRVLLRLALCLAAGVAAALTINGCAVSGFARSGMWYDPSSRVGTWSGYGWRGGYVTPTYEREHFYGSRRGGDYTYRSYGGHDDGPDLREWIDRDNPQRELGMHNQPRYRRR